MGAGQPLVRVLARWWVDLSVVGGPVGDGPMVVAANHYSHLDPVMVSLAVDRPVRYLALDELYGHSRLFDRLTLWLGAIPMSRTRPPVGPMRFALAVLGAGGVVGMFPEGHRVWVWGETSPKRGAAWLARRAGVPMLPVAIAGTDQALGRGARRVARKPVTLIVAEPIHPQDFDEESDPVGAMTEEWARRVGDALRETYQVPHRGDPQVTGNR